MDSSPFWFSHRPSPAWAALSYQLSTLLHRSHLATTNSVVDLQCNYCSNAAFPHLLSGKFSGEKPARVVAQCSNDPVVPCHSQDHTLYAREDNVFKQLRDLDVRVSTPYINNNEAFRV